MMRFFIELFFCEKFWCSPIAIYLLDGLITNKQMFNGILNDSKYNAFRPTLQTTIYLNLRACILPMNK
jgi:hypothetical protein